MKDKETLEIRLLEAQIANLEKQNRSGLLREVLPSLWAIIFSIVASIVVIMIGDKVVENAMTELNKIESEINMKNQQLGKLTVRYNQLDELCTSLVGKAMLYDLGVNFKVDIETDKNTYLVHATSDSPNTKFRAYDMCKNNFIFPGDAPNTSLCNEIEGHCAQENNIQSCTFGPFFIGAFDEGIWISAEAKGKIVFRYVNMKVH